MQKIYNFYSPTYNNSNGHSHFLTPYYSPISFCNTLSTETANTGGAVARNL